MKEKKLTIKFYLNLNKPCKKGYKIYMRVTYDQKKFEIASEHYSTNDQWNNLVERDKKSERINK